jgi:outer membrane protein
MPTSSARHFPDGLKPVMMLSANIATLVITMTTLLLGSAGFTVVQAETLKDALASAYASNPQLDAERARLRATDENVSQAHSQFRPTVTGNASVGWQDNQTRPSSPSNGSFNPRSVGVAFTQPIFRGFRSLNGLNVAEAQVRAGRETLRSTEQVVLIGAVTSFMDVVRDQAIVKLRENNQKVLTDTLRSTRDQFTVGEVTRTDVAQAEASLSAGVSALELAKANLKGSRATYERFVGHPPTSLVEPKPLSKALPKGTQEAISIATQETPAVVAALYNEEVARYTVDLIRGELLPTLSLEGSYTDTLEPSKLTDESRSAQVTGKLSVPLYEGGAVYSRVRQAKHTHLAALQEVHRAKTEAQATVVSAWSQHLAARAQQQSDQAAVEANRIALQGVREEEKVGQRTKLDVLNAEQTYLNAQVNLATTRRNVVVNDYTVLQAIGRLNVLEVASAGEVYDPQAHYFEVRRQWWGLDITHADGRREALDVWHTHGKDHSSMK